VATIFYVRSAQVSEIQSTFSVVGFLLSSVPFHNHSITAFAFVHVDRRRVCGSAAGPQARRSEGTAGRH